MSVHERPFVERYLPALLAQAAHLMVGDFVDEIRSHGLSLLEIPRHCRWGCWPGVQSPSSPR